MRALSCLTLLAWLAIASVGYAQARPSADTSSAFFERLIAERRAAAKRGDTVAYRHFVDPDMVYIDDDGSRQSFGEHLRRVAAAGEEEDRIHRDIDSLHVYFVGDVALVDYWTLLRERYGSRDVTSPYRVLDTFVLRGDQWLLVRHAETHALALPTPIAMSSSALNDYVGRYEWWPGYIDTITRVGNQLFEQGTGEKTATLNFAATPEAFYIAADPSLLVFVRDKTGRVVGYLLHWPDGQVTSARRLH